MKPAADFPDEPEMRVSHETIYQSIYVQGRGALREELAASLRTGRAVLRPRRGEERRGRIPGTVSISERPAEAGDRAQCPVTGRATWSSGRRRRR